MSLSSGIPEMTDSDIESRVSSLLGRNAKILDCEKKSSLVTEEVLLLNGQPVTLSGELAAKVKEALKAGLPPPAEILSEMLIRTGIQTAPVQVETVTTVKSNTKTSELSTLKDGRGEVLDEKVKEFEEDDEFESTNVEIWEKEQGQKETFSEWGNRRKGQREKSPERGNSRREKESQERSILKQSNNTAPQVPFTLPGRMPHIAPIKPPIPPKPKQGIRLAPSYVGNLRTDANLTLPVRVVYETFI